MCGHISSQCGLVIRSRFLAHFDRVNLEFLGEDNDTDRFVINLNYGLDSIFTTTISPADFKAIVSDTPLGYNVEFMISLKLIRTDIITFNLWITDHDSIGKA